MSKPIKETLTIDGRTYAKFIPWPKTVRDGTLRCIFCGQIDEEPYHDPKLCPACSEWADPTPTGAP